MRSDPVGAEPVEHRNSHRRSEIPVRSAGGGVLIELDADAFGDLDRALRQSLGHMRLVHGRTGDPATHRQRSSLEPRPQPVDRGFQLELRLGRPGPSVDPGPRLGGNHVVATPATDLADVDAGALDLIGEGVQRDRLMGELVDRRDAAPMTVARMSRSTLNVHLVARQAGAGSGDRASRTGGSTTSAAAASGPIPPPVAAPQGFRSPRRR